MKKLLNIYFKFINRFRCVSKNDIETKDLCDIESGIFLDMVVSGCIWFLIVIKACVTYQENVSQVLLNDSILGYAEQTTTLIQEICRSFQSWCNHPSIVLVIWICMVAILAAAYAIAAESRTYKLAFIFYVLSHIVSLVGFVKIAIACIIFTVVVIIPGIVYYLPLWFITKITRLKNKHDFLMKHTNNLIDRFEQLLRG